MKGTMRILDHRLTANILKQYYVSQPSPQNAVDLFRGEWASSLPAVGEIDLKSGQTPLFDDRRIHWGDEQLGFRDKRVLELGPLEGGHSYLLERKGAVSVLAIEANARAYLKCLIVKELYGLNRCSFVLGDFVEFLKTCGDRFDCCIAAGVLYHMQDPVELISLISKVADQALIWTHYYDTQTLKRRTRIGTPRFGPEEQAVYQGFTYARAKQHYALGLQRLAFCGGTAKHSYWMKRNGIIEALNHFGFRTVKISFDDHGHRNGPAFCLACSKD
jgi:hypothetical protein